MKKLVIFLIPLFLITSCSNTEENKEDTRDYSDYFDFSLTSVDELYQKEEEKYFVEIYFPECKYCKAIKDTVFNYIDAYKNNDSLTKLYIFDIQSSSTLGGKSNRDKFKTKPASYSDADKKLMIEEMVNNKPTTLEETYFFGTPSLYIVENGAFSELISGSTMISNYLSSLL